jgi:hypothetical protein
MSPAMRVTKTQSDLNSQGEIGVDGRGTCWNDVTLLFPKATE